MEKRLKVTHDKLTDKLNNWCEISYEVNKTSYRNCKIRQFILWRKSWPHDSCLMQDFICIEAEWTSQYTPLFKHMLVFQQEVHVEKVLTTVG